MARSQVIVEVLLLKEIIERHRVVPKEPHDSVSLYAAQLFEIFEPSIERIIASIQESCTLSDHTDGTPRFKSMVKLTPMTGGRVMAKCERCLKEWYEDA